MGLCEALGMVTRLPPFCERSIPPTLLSVMPWICQPPARRPRRVVWTVLKMSSAHPSRGDEFPSARCTACKTDPARWGMEAAGAPCPGCPHSPCSSPRLPWALPPWSQSAGPRCVSLWCGGANVGKREEEEMEQAGESSRWRRTSIAEAESGQWGHQPFGLVPHALEAPFLPSRGLAGAAAGGPVQRWGRGCSVSGGHGIKPFCTGEGRLFSCRGVTN